MSSTPLLTTLSDLPRTVAQIAVAAKSPESTETTFLLLEHLAANPRVRVTKAEGVTTFVRHPLGDDR
jgi:hypothetical protein